MPRYVVSDLQNRMPTLEVKMFGKVRSVLVIFADEGDALDVGAHIEHLSGTMHQVLKVDDDFVFSVFAQGAGNE